ncbi:toxin co-regulated pilus biosynthesis Q family protein [Pseudomonas aeruginosa]|uniref:toxin co-regulated pilus biosynthesis Q family protein n=1 Tax=Pseudomonas aeruginosa TaxID=287 RepID=UPI001E3CCDDC|nr:toxin co-regulated pilus biosynthesis Q family protein [Pseudomonas aeruginosa]MCC9290089.1 toxin co-regulated pilus biosynthesis Q family protein [Pseudomonas aeruginosa]UVN19091.1 putative PilL-like lipoprotein [Pseudomonas aeruginosa]
MKILVSIAAALAILAVAAHAGFFVTEEPPVRRAPSAAVPAAMCRPASAAVATAARPTAVNQPGATTGLTDASVPAAYVGGFTLLAVSFVGQPSGQVEIRRGIGRQLRITVALKQIAPVAWHGYLIAELVGRVDQGKLVDSRGGRRWVQVLDILATEQGLSAEVDWYRREIFIGEQRPLYAPATASAAAKVPPPPPPKPQWVAKPASTLKTSVQELGKKAGWYVVWNADYDYPIKASLTYEGSLLDAITTLFRSYEKAEKPFWVDVYQKQTPPVVAISARN